LSDLNFISTKMAGTRQDKHSQTQVYHSNCMWQADANHFTCNMCRASQGCKAFFKLNLDVYIPSLRCLTCMHTHTYTHTHMQRCQRVQREMESQLEGMLKLCASLRQTQPPFLGRWVMLGRSSCLSLALFLEKVDNFGTEPPLRGRSPLMFNNVRLQALSHKTSSANKKGTFKKHNFC